MKPGETLPNTLNSLDKDELKLYQSILDSGKPKVLKFTANWCEPCKRMKKWYDPIAEQNKHIDFIDINLGEREQGQQKNTIISSLFGIMTIPSVFLISGDNVVLKRVLELNPKGFVDAVKEDFDLIYDKGSKSFYTIGEKMVGKNPFDNDKISDTKQLFAGLYDKLSAENSKSMQHDIKKSILLSDIVRTCNSYVVFLNAEEYE